MKNGATIEHGNTYNWHAVHGRLDNVVSSASTHIYSYVPTSNLVDAVTTQTGATTAFTAKNTWLTDRDALDLKENKNGSAVLISKYDYSVNALTQRTGVATSGSAFNTAASAGTTAWGYDALGQVVSADAPATAKDFGYLYDFMGNRKQSSRNTTNVNTTVLTNKGVYRSGTNGASSLGTNALNQNLYLNLYNAPAVSVYDLDGNQTEGLFPASFPSIPLTGPRTWDGENRLVGVAPSGLSSQYTYDIYHRRVATRVGATTSYTLYDGWNPVSEYQTTSAAAPTLLNSYTWGTDLSGTFQGAGGVGGLLSVKQYPTGLTYYPTYDGNGNVSEYLNSTGSTIAHYEYGPFGEQTFITGGTLPASFRHRFSTKPLDTESGYYYYGYRLYDPLSGRWINRDPISEIGGINLYNSLSGDMLSEVDVLGQLALGPLLANPIVQEFLNFVQDIISNVIANEITEDDPLPPPSNPVPPKDPPPAPPPPPYKPDGSPSAECDANTNPKFMDQGPAIQMCTMPDGKNGWKVAQVSFTCTCILKEDGTLGAWLWVPNIDPVSECTTSYADAQKVHNNIVTPPRPVRVD
jgi:RHS repeat-associated protein